MIGNNYVDTVTFDVVKIDARHLLLGRPLQFDRFAIHDGHNNTYSFQWHTKKIFVLPVTQTPTATPKQPANKTLLITSNGSQLQNQLKKTDFLMGFLLKDYKEGSATTLQVVKPLLQKFQDLSPA